MGSCSIWGAPMSRSRSAGIASSSVRSQAALAGLDGVEQAVVIAREDRPGDKRLVGYVTGTADPAELRAALAERLPAYMVPAAVVVLDALPLTVNGKLDTRALPAPEYTDVDRYRAPANAIEEILAGIYAQVLGLERVGVDDSFFDLGGDSLSAMRVIAAINTGLDAGLAVRALFEAPTVAQLAPRIGAQPGVGLEPLVAVERPAVVPLSFAQNRLWFIDQLQGPSPVYNMAVALRLSGRLDVEALGAALADVVGRHESLRTLFAAPEGIPQQLVVPVERADFGWQVVDASGWSAEPAGGGHRRGGASTRLTWPTEIPLRATAFPRRRRRARAGGGGAPYRRRRLVDHPAGGVIWGWPMPAGARGRRPGGRRCRCSTSITRCGSARSSVISTTPTAASPRSWRYWEQALAGMPERLELPTDRPYPPVADYRGARVAVDWPARVAAAGRAGGSRAQCDQFHGDAGRPGGAAGQAQRQLRCGGGVPDRRAPRPGAR